jgi:chemotaxis protein histidine kinase CheA
VDSNSLQDDFKEEVLRLFALEAVEWIKQTKAAVSELEGNPPPERANILFEVTLRNLTNLKGSAATVDLPSIGNLAFMLVPLLQNMQQDQRFNTGDYYGALYQGLDALSSVTQILGLAETKELVMDDLETVTRRQADALQNAVAKARAGHGFSREKLEPERHSAEALKVIEALMQIKRAPSVASETNRGLAEFVLRKIHSSRDAESATILGVSVMCTIQELEQLDEKFLEEARHRSSTISTTLSALSGEPPDTPDYEKKTREALRDIALLYERARMVQADGICRFLHGLEIFLLTALYKRAPILPQRFEAVASRVGTLIALAEEWVEAGRRERKEVEKALAEMMASTPT